MEIDYILWQEGKYYVAQCLNVEVSSFGETIDEAVNNLKEAVELYFENEKVELLPITKVMIGKSINRRFIKGGIAQINVNGSNNK